MTGRYLRGDDERKIVEVAEARKRKRAADEARDNTANQRAPRDEKEG
jgi:hypothetical protein